MQRPHSALCSRKMCLTTACCVLHNLVINFNVPEPQVDTTTAEHQDLSHTSSSDMRHENDRSDDLISERALSNILVQQINILHR